jgi:site-specific recombinase XerC
MPFSTWLSNKKGVEIGLPICVHFHVIRCTLVHVAANSPHKLGPRNVALVQLMLQAGLRVGETTALKHGDLQLKSRSGHVHVRHGKGLKARDIPLNRTARQALQVYLSTLAPDSVG